MAFWYVYDSGLLNSFCHRCRTLSKKNRLVKVRDFRGATSDNLDNLTHHLTPIMKKEPDNIIPHVGTSDAKFKTSRQIFDHLLRLKNFKQHPQLQNNNIKINCVLLTVALLLLLTPILIFSVRIRLL